jgi:succinate dehydrogenase / fumarate reductase flavoprotein subunit
MMKETIISGDGGNVRLYTLNTVVVGTGAAGYNAADRLYDYGQKDIAIVTENINCGTSRNTGSDKQTYYKLTLSGGDPDSVRDMAQTLFEGHCVDGDIALCEAALSAQEFLKLVALGVPFPKNRYGEYIGYKTDHDQRRRATSVGPYTSKMMTECLEKSVMKKEISIFNGLQVIRILSYDGAVCGLLCLDRQKSGAEAKRFVAFHCQNIVWATGGPAGIYADSVYPFGHYGASGLAFAAGAAGKNLTEWQYGLASLKPRWNVSGTYMQVIPQFISTKEDGSDKREFLYDFFASEADLLTKVFLKGYQWPFDVRKVADGSSIIDILVYLERKKGRRVYLDFRSNPGNKDLDFSLLATEAYNYLNQAGACFGTPLRRLLHMNKPAVDFYHEHGVDLSKEPLEISLCAQHNNGGLEINEWWQTNIKGLFAVGEVAASHGVYRPGGSALNAGQVGSTRAAQYIAAYYTGLPEDKEFQERLQTAMADARDLCDAVISNKENLADHWKECTNDMSAWGAAIRSESGLKFVLDKAEKAYRGLKDTVRITSPAHLHYVFRLRDILLCQQVYLSAMLNYLQSGGKSRGSALYTDPEGQKPFEQLPQEFTFRVDDGSKNDLVQEVVWKDGTCRFTWRKVRPIPEDDDFFENVWREYRKNQNIY